MTISLTYAQLKALKPCADRLKANAATFGPAKDRTAAVTFQQLKDGGATLDDLVWLASTIGFGNPDCDRRSRLWAADCAARVLHIYETNETSPAPRNAIVAARQFARGEIDAAAMASASAAAWTAAMDAGEAAAAMASALVAASAAAWDTVSAARVAARAAEWAAAKNTEKTWQFQRLVDRMSDPEPEDWPLPALPVKHEAA